MKWFGFPCCDDFLAAPSTLGLSFLRPSLLVVGMERFSMSGLGFWGKVVMLQGLVGWLRVKVSCDLQIYLFSRAVRAALV